ncbi:MAG: hypothetical protein AAGC55_20120, partial [Myxococcota bacterium]
ALVVARGAGGALARESSTHVSVFVPPNNNFSDRQSMLVVTAHHDGTAVTITDTDEDGDSDDSQSVTLERGQSHIVRIKGGTINDGYGGKADGDRFIVDADQPVAIMIVTESYWQHDWVPSTEGGMRGREFFVWGAKDNLELDVIAYEDDTRIEVYDITATPTSEGTAIVSLPGTLKIALTLAAGEDMLVHHGLTGADLIDKGRSYRVIANKAVTMQYGSLDSLNGSDNAVDGGGFVPSANGTTMGTHFYFPIVTDDHRTWARELRIVVGDQASDLTIRGWNQSSGWTTIENVGLDAFGRFDMTGQTHSKLRGNHFFEVRASQPIAVFEASWLETGATGTSDVYSFISALDTATDVGTEFVAYLGPPGIEDNFADNPGRYAHLYISSFLPGTVATVTDVDTGGALVNQTVTIVNSDDIADVRIDQATYDQLNQPSAGRRPYLRVVADQPVSVAMANWNDNWLAFTSGSLPAMLQVELTGPSTGMPCNVTVPYTLEVENIGTVTIDSTEVAIELINEVVATPSSITVGTLAPGEHFTTTVAVSADCNDVTTGDLAGITATARGNPNIGTTPVTAAATRTEALTVIEPPAAGVMRFGAVEDHCVVELSWLSLYDAANVEYVVRRSASDPEGTYTELARVPSLGVGP